MLARPGRSKAYIFRRKEDRRPTGGISMTIPIKAYTKSLGSVALTDPQRKDSAIANGIPSSGRLVMVIRIDHKRDPADNNTISLLDPPVPQLGIAIVEVMND